MKIRPNNKFYMKRFYSLIVIIVIFYNFCEAQDNNSKKDTIVIEFDDNNRLLIPGMPTYEPGGESLLYISYPEFQRKGSVEFVLSFWGIDGDIMNNFLIFEHNDDLIINSLEYKFSRALYFCEDGSGGTWAGSDEFFTDWNELSLYEQDVYDIPDLKAAEPFPIIPEEAIIKAEEQLEKNSLLDYSEQTGSVIIKINYTLKKKEYIKELIFYYLYGD